MLMFCSVTDHFPPVLKFFVSLYAPEPFFEASEKRINPGVPWDIPGWPRTLENRENRENDEKKFPAGKKSGNEILLKIRGKSGNFKKSYLCKVKIFKFYSCSDVATGGFFLPYA